MAKKTEFDNTNSGVLFVNDKKGNEKRPDYTGKLSIKVSDFEPDKAGNVDIRLAAWTRESEKVGTFYSIKAQPPQSE